MKNAKQQRNLSEEEARKVVVGYVERLMAGRWGGELELELASRRFGFWITVYEA